MGIEAQVSNSLISNLTSPSLNIPFEGGFLCTQMGVRIHDTENSSQGASLQTKNLSLNRLFSGMRRTYENCGTSAPVEMWFRNPQFQKG